MLWIYRRLKALNLPRIREIRNQRKKKFSGPRMGKTYWRSILE